MSKVSIIIPNYNHARFLDQRFNSILNQTYQDFEVIILDDCSTDNSRTIIEKYQNHPKVNAVIYNDTNSGNTFSQWKKGIELAKGEWIWIAESDDWCETSLLSELINAVVKDPICTLGYCQSIAFKDNDILWVRHVNRLEEYLDGKFFVQNNMLQNNELFNASMCIFKRSEYFNISQEFVNYKFMGDWLFWVEIALKGNVFISGRTLNYFRKNTKGVSSSAFASGLSYSEYFRFLKYLEITYALVGNKNIQLLRQKQKQFLIDVNIAPSLKIQINKTFKHHLGIKYYFGFTWLYTWLIKSRIKEFLS